MSDQLPEELVLNGINGITGESLLKMSTRELQAIALGAKYSKAHYRRLKDRKQRDEQAFDLEFGRKKNDLGQAGWGIIFPSQDPSGKYSEIYDALKELRDWRKEEAGDLFREFVKGDGYFPEELADGFMKRFGAKPGPVNPKKIPYYLLIVGDPCDIPFRFQYEMDCIYLVGRIQFDTPQEYANYGHSVVEAEKKKLHLSRRTAVFGTRHGFDKATEISSTGLVKLLSDELAASQGLTGKTWQIEYYPPDDCKRSLLECLLGKGKEAPALLFTATHGVGFDYNDPKQEKMQLPFQGGLVCQDRKYMIGQVKREEYLAAEDISDDFRLHGLIAFHFACYGLGTPQYDYFTRIEKKKPERIAKSEFIAALPRRLLSHPKGGALAVIGHIDRAWTYSIQWTRNDDHTGVFKDTMLRLMAGERVGLALDQFNMRFAQIAVELNEMLNRANMKRPDPSDLLDKWMTNNDARGYALLGDPAVHLMIAEENESPENRAEIVMPDVK
jgi:hypothetical protein